MEGNTRSTLNLLRWIFKLNLKFRLFHGARCEPGLRRAWQLQVVLRLVTQPQVRRLLTKPLIANSGWNSTATWGSWGAWSSCSENCDRSRERDCLFEDGMVAPSSLCDGCGQDDISCSSGSIEYKDCEDGLCGGSTTEGTTTEGSIKVF